MEHLKYNINYEKLVGHNSSESLKTVSLDVDALSFLELQGGREEVPMLLKAFLEFEARNSDFSTRREGLFNNQIFSDLNFYNFGFVAFPGEMSFLVTRSRFLSYLNNLCDLECRFFTHQQKKTKLSFTSRNKEMSRGRAIMPNYEE